MNITIDGKRVFLYRTITGPRDYEREQWWFHEQEFSDVGFAEFLLSHAGSVEAEIDAWKAKYVADAARIFGCSPDASVSAVVDALFYKKAPRYTEEAGRDFYASHPEQDWHARLMALCGFTEIEPSASRTWSGMSIHDPARMLRDGL